MKKNRQNGRLGMADMRRIYGGHTADIQQICGGYMADIRPMVGRYAADIQQTCGGHAPVRLVDTRRTYGASKPYQIVVLLDGPFRSYIISKSCIKIFRLEPLSKQYQIQNKSRGLIIQSFV